MKILNKRELQQTAEIIHWILISPDLVKICNNYTAEPYSFLLNDTTKGEKLQCDINREVGNISVLSSCKICKYEYLTSEEILSSNQEQIIE